MKQLLQSLQLEASEGRHVFEYASLPIDWWASDHPTNYEIELIFGDELHIFLFYFVPDTEGVVERAMMMATEFDAHTSELQHAVIAQELQKQFFSTASLTFDEEQGGYQLQELKQVEELIQQLMDVLDSPVPIAHSTLPEAAAKAEGEDTVEYVPGSYLPHFIDMYYMNNDQLPLTKENIESFILLAINMESEDYVTYLQHDCAIIHLKEAEILRNKILISNEEHGFNQEKLDLVVNTVQAFQLTK